MDRNLTKTSESVRFRIDATQCDGQGVCVLIAPELFALDRYGLAYVVPGADAVADADAEVRARGLEADAMCPRNAIFEQRLAAPAPEDGETKDVLAAASVAADTPAAQALAVETAAVGAAPTRLVVEQPESVAGWVARGGFGAVDGLDLIHHVEGAGVLGQGGAGFPTATKWRRVAGRPRAIVVVNGAEREPGTVKDRYLLGRRPGLLLDGLRLAMVAVGAVEAVVAVDEEAVEEHDAVLTAIAEAASAGLLDGLDVRTHKVPTRYVAGEETALLSLIDGHDARPRRRPPFPSDVGLAGRPTLVQNAETLAQVALCVALGVAEYTSVGADRAPGTGLFSVGPFGGETQVVERPYGYPLEDLLTETGHHHGFRAVLVGGYAGGLLAPGALDVPLTHEALVAVGASLGTKSIQVIGTDQCPVGVAAEIVGYFAGETADQCPPCTRGLPDMAQLLCDLESGTGGAAAAAELGEFMSTLFDRGICRLPDGAARLTMSLLTHFEDDVAAHAASGCPSRGT